MIKKIVNLILAYMVRVTIIVAIALLSGFIISKVINQPLYHVLEIFGIGMIAIGGLSLFGDLNLRSKVNINLSKFLLGNDNFIRVDNDLTSGSYRFAVYTGLSGVLMFLITCIMYYL